VSDDDIDYPALIADMRTAAEILERLNVAYEGGKFKWSPDDLRYEADYLGRHTRLDEEETN
jgi:hypothetical protein